MLKLRHFAGAVAGLALSIGIIGCATTNSDIPANAQMTASGNESVSYTAPRSGMIYVLDKNTNKLVYSGEVHKGQSLTIDASRPDHNITLDGNTVTQQELNNGHTYQI
jgi:hypothetical protein